MISKPKECWSGESVGHWYTILLLPGFKQITCIGNPMVHIFNWTVWPSYVDWQERVCFIYIYIYIYNHPQTLLYHNSSMWLDTQAGI